MKGIWAPRLRSAQVWHITFILIYYDNIHINSVIAVDRIYLDVLCVALYSARSVRRVWKRVSHWARWVLLLKKTVCIFGEKARTRLNSTGSRWCIQLRNFDHYLTLAFDLWPQYLLGSYCHQLHQNCKFGEIPLSALGNIVTFETHARTDTRYTDGQTNRQLENIMFPTTNSSLFSTVITW